MKTIYKMLNSRSLLACILLPLVSMVHAEDIEIFMQSGVTGSDVSSIPQVMFNLEYTSRMASSIGCNNVDPDNIAGTCPGAKGVEAFFTEMDLEDGVIDQFELTRAVLTRVLIPLGGIKVGMMMYHDHDNNCAGPDSGQCSGGGYVFNRMVEFKPVPPGMDVDNPADVQLILDADENKRIFLERLRALPTPQGNLSASAQHKELYFELFRYLTGQRIYNGHNGWTNFNTSSDYNLGDWYETNHAQADFYCDPDSDCTSADSGGIYRSGKPSLGEIGYRGDFADMDGTGDNRRYISTYPFRWDELAEYELYYNSPLEDCARVFMINVLYGQGNQQDDADGDIERPWSEGGLDISNLRNGREGFVQVVRKMFEEDLADGRITNNHGTLELLDKQNVTSYFLAQQEQQLDNAAVAGGTGRGIPLTGDARQVLDAIEAIFSDILAVSSTYLAASIPASTAEVGEAVDSTFTALFQPDENIRPFWFGNIKKVKLDTYEICVETDDLGECTRYETQLQMVDAKGDQAFFEGQLRADALTFWTDPLGYDLLDYDESLGETRDTDGRVVYRGGAGQQIPNFLDNSARGVPSMTNVSGGRQLFTDYQGGLIPLEWSQIGNIWSNLYNNRNEHRWPETYDQNGAQTSMTGAWEHDKNLLLYPDAIDGCTTSLLNGLDSVNTQCDADNQMHYQIHAKDFTIEDLAYNLLAYMRGFDVMDEDGNGIVWQTRRWIMGDILHSRPTPLNYGARVEGYDLDENPDIRIVFGSNDGFVRMLRNTRPDGSEAGDEQWAYMPSEVMHSQIQLMYNAASGDPVHPYGADSSPSFFRKDVCSDGSVRTGLNDCNEIGSTVDPADQMYIAFGLRRGGRALYGMDLTDPTNPELLWTITPDTAGFEELGYSFSQPVVRTLRWGEDGELRPVMIVGAGYDRENKDTIGEPVLGTPDDMGNAIYIVDMKTGELVWKVTGDASATCHEGTSCQYLSAMQDSIPSDVTAIADRSGSVYRVYVGDTGGNVWRIDLTDGTDFSQSHPVVSNWRAHHLLAIGRHAGGGTTLENDRRFFHAPDVVSAQDSSGRYIGVVIGSGNRAHPLQTVTKDAMVLYKDRGYLPEQPHELIDLMDLTDNCIQEADLTCSESEIAKLSTGWKVYFVNDGKFGEKNLGTPRTVLGTIYFSTYVPAGADSVSAASCGPALGGSYEYAINLHTASAVYPNARYTPGMSPDGQVLGIEDRRRKSQRAGMSVAPVVVSYGGVLSVITSDAVHRVGESELSRTYWFEHNR